MTSNVDSVLARSEANMLLLCANTGASQEQLAAIRAAYCDIRSAHQLSKNSTPTRAEANAAIERTLAAYRKIGVVLGVLTEEADAELAGPALCGTIH